MLTSLICRITNSCQAISSPCTIGSVMKVNSGESSQFWTSSFPFRTSSQVVALWANKTPLGRSAIPTKSGSETFGRTWREQFSARKLSRRAFRCRIRELRQLKMPQQELPRKRRKMLKASGTAEELADLIIKVAKELPLASTPLSLQVFQASSLRKPIKR